MARAVFLDRDDTLIRCNDVTPHGDLGDPALVEPLPGVEEALRSLRGAGYELVVVTNQGGVARGRYACADVERVHARLDELLPGLVAAYRYCPYHPEGSVEEFRREHAWRKPSPGMLLDAAEALGLDLAGSWMVGDKVRDCEAGKAAGCRTVMIGTNPPDRLPPSVDFVASSMPVAARIILRESGRGG